MNNHGGKFIDGLFLGAVLGGAAVFLLGTKTGKNLLKIVSEQGLDGLANLLEEYDFSDWEEGEEEFGEPSSASNTHAKSNSETPEEKEEAPEAAPKKRFFRRRK